MRSSLTSHSSQPCTVREFAVLCEISGHALRRTSVPCCRVRVCQLTPQAPFRYPLLAGPGRSCRNAFPGSSGLGPMAAPDPKTSAANLGVVWAWVAFSSFAAPHLAQRAVARHRPSHVGMHGSRVGRNEKGCQQVAALGTLAVAASLVPHGRSAFALRTQPASLWPCDTMLPPPSGPLLL